MHSSRGSRLISPYAELGEATEERSDPRMDSPLNHSIPPVEKVETILKLLAMIEAI